MRKPAKTKRETVKVTGKDTNPRVAADPASSATMTPRGKIGLLVALLRQTDGTTIDAMMHATGWQAHSVRGALSGSVKKALGLNLLSEKTGAGRVYRIADGTAA